MSIITVGIDLAKNVFAVHGVTEAGKAELIKPRVARGQLMELIARLPPCLIGMKARCAPLGTAISSAWPHCAAHRPEVRHAVPPLRQTRQE